MKSKVVVAICLIGLCFNAHAQLTNGVGWVNGYYIGPGEYLSGAYLSGADLAAADLTNADLSNSNLTGARLWGAQMRGASFGGCKLSFKHRVYLGMMLGLRSL